MHQLGRRTAALAAFSMLGVLGACAGRESCPTPNFSANTGTVNKVCPVVMEDGIGKDAPRREWRGQVVGFCCDDCVPKWDSWSEKQKDESLARALAKGR